MEYLKGFKIYEQFFEIEYFNQNPFIIEKTIADKYRLKAYNFLHDHHYKSNPSYKTFYDIQFKINKKVNNELAISARSFKDMYLSSINDDDVFKVLTSSGTTGTVPSRIVLDKKTAKAQSKVLTYLLKSFIKHPRLPMLVIDSKSILKDRKSFSARGAGIIGFSQVAKNITYALDENYDLDANIVNEFLKKYSSEKFLIFGFTYLIYERLILKRNSKIINKNIFKNAILFHGGGWKKLSHLGISNSEFKAELAKFYGINVIHNYYGMVEQTGSIYIECKEGFFHNSIFSDIEIVDSSLNELPFGNKGLLKLKSVLPYSYPGHFLLTEDIGVCYGQDNCKCGLKGKFFHVLGRAKKAEIRGCSDVK